MMLRWVLLVLCGLIAACQVKPGVEPRDADIPRPEQYENWPNSLDGFRFHWTAAPGIDLTTGPAVLVRAYIESYEIANLTFDEDNVYPGFLRATAENEPTDRIYSSELVGIRPRWLDRGQHPIALEHFGFNTDYMLELSPTSSGFRAVVCTGSYSNFIKATARADSYVSVSSLETDRGVVPYGKGPDAGISVRQIEFTQNDPRIPKDAPRPVNTPQEGPVPAPQEDVFGNWFVTASSSSGWGPITRPELNNFPSPNQRRQCGDAMPHNENQRIEMMTGYKNQLPFRGEARPGWPQHVG